MGFTPAVSSTDTELYRVVREVTLETFPEAGFVPQVVGGFTDSHFFRDLGITSYGYTATATPARGCERRPRQRRARDGGERATRRRDDAAHPGALRGHPARHAGPLADRRAAEPAAGPPTRPDGGPNTSSPTPNAEATMADRYDVATLEARELVPGHHGRFLHTEHTTQVYWEIEADARLPEHHHPAEQTVHMLEGTYELTVDGGGLPPARRRRARDPGRRRALREGPHPMPDPGTSSPRCGRSTDDSRRSCPRACHSWGGGRPWARSRSWLPASWDRSGPAAETPARADRGRDRRRTRRVAGPLSRPSRSSDTTPKRGKWGVPYSPGSSRSGTECSGPKPTSASSPRRRSWT